MGDFPNPPLASRAANCYFPLCRNDFQQFPPRLRHGARFLYWVKRSNPARASNASGAPMKAPV
jgi:hypothetical protein